MTTQYQVRLSDLVAAFRDRTASIYTCENVARLMGYPGPISNITEPLHDQLHELASDMIKVRTLQHKGVMDDWLDEEFFYECEIPEVKDMCKYIRFRQDGAFSTHINDDAKFKLAFYAYLLERQGDVVFTFNL